MDAATVRARRNTRCGDLSSQSWSELCPRFSWRSSRTGCSHDGGGLTACPAPYHDEGPGFPCDGAVGGHTEPPGSLQDGCLLTVALQCRDSRWQICPPGDWRGRGAMEGDAPVSALSEVSR